MEIIDISMTVKEDMPVYPGNPNVEIEKYRQVPEDSTTESRIEMGSHTGTHVDAPQHVVEDGKSVKELEVSTFRGECQVLDLTVIDGHVERGDLEKESLEEDIIILKTDNSLGDRAEFFEGFTALKLSAVEYLVESGVETVGVDYLSLTPFNAGEDGEEAHRLAIEEMTVFEGLDLSGVEPGKYEFVGLPLKIDADGGPARAILLD